MSINHLLVLPRLQIQNANTISSSLTYGFPAITAFLGFMWALERKLKQCGQEFEDIELNNIGVVCHDYQEQVSQAGFTKSFNLTRNPVDKTGATSAINEEGRIHLNISLIIGIYNDAWENNEPLKQQQILKIAEVVNQMRIAGGTIIPPQHPQLKRYQAKVYLPKDTDYLKKQLLPGFALVCRDDLLDSRHRELLAKDDQATRLDAWLSLCRINWRYNEQANDGKGEWQHDRAGLGWVVPIPVGYGALTELQPAGTVVSARDNTTPFRFVESLYSIGQWVSPLKINNIEQLLWYSSADTEQGLYRCYNQFLTN